MALTRPQLAALIAAAGRGIDEWEADLPELPPEVGAVEIATANRALIVLHRAVPGVG